MIPLKTPDANLKSFLELPYDELQHRNMELKRLVAEHAIEDVLREKVVDYLQDEPRIKALTIAFSDLEGKLHMLDYDKHFFLSSHGNLTFDGSSVRGFSELGASDLRLKPDWGSFRFLPSDVFGPGKVMMFAFVCGSDGEPFPTDFRGRLKKFTEELHAKNLTAYMAPEIEGFLFDGVDVEQLHRSGETFQLVTQGGYFNSLPQDSLRQFIDKVAEVQRALAFENEKDHGEVAPSQFEINFKYADVLTACDQVLLYKLTARQVAKMMGCTACFLPKPIMGLNGSGMHVNVSVAQGDVNLFFDEKGKDNMSDFARRFIEGLLMAAPEFCLAACPSVNAYRRLDPNFEAPNDIRCSSRDRSAIVRIPIGNEKSARIELRAVSPDVNPYMLLLIMLQSGLGATDLSEDDYALLQEKLETRRIKKLWPTIHDAITAFKRSEFLLEVLGEEAHQKYLSLKMMVANRSARELGSKLKREEVIYHHEVTNQTLWSDF